MVSKLAFSRSKIFNISVLPGGVSSARVKESSASLERNLHPGQIIDQIVFEVFSFSVATTYTVPVFDRVCPLCGHTIQELARGRDLCPI